MNDIMNVESTQAKEVLPTTQEALINLEEEALIQEALINKKDFLKDAVQRVLQNIIEAEFDAYIQAKKFERIDSRKGLRNGSYDRKLHTRVGTIELHVCRDREGVFQTALFDRYQRYEKAFISTLAEMFINGVSTRKVSAIVEELCGQGISKSMVSKINTDLDAELEKWRNRSLNADYPYLILDARYEKVRDNGVVVSKAVVICIGITKDGIREVIGCSVINSESFEAWDGFVASLKDRGLKGVEFVVTDDNQGLKKALLKHFQGVKLQRCQVHFMRNFLSKLAKKDQREPVLLLKEVFAAHSKERAMQALSHLLDYLKERKKYELIEWLEDNIEETLTVLALPYEHVKKMKSSNMLERFNEELKRRTRVIRIFPNDQSCLRLVTALCQDATEKWSGRKYIDMDVLRK